MSVTARTSGLCSRTKKRWGALVGAGTGLEHLAGFAGLSLPRARARLIGDTMPDSPNGSADKPDEAQYDQTLEDSFPASDPASSISPTRSGTNEAAKKPPNSQ
jgi:hypothetical protein